MIINPALAVPNVTLTVPNVTLAVHNVTLAVPNVTLAVPNVTRPYSWLFLTSPALAVFLMFQNPLILAQTA
jgi:hypothetical protein